MIVATLKPPSIDAGDVIDGSTAAFKADHPEAGDLFAEQHGDEEVPGDTIDQHAGDFGRAEDDSAGPGTGSSDDWPLAGGEGGADSEGGETDAAGDVAEFEAGAAAAIAKATGGRRGRKTRASVE